MSEPDYMVGIADNGERLRFEGWVYRAHILGELRDPDLLRAVRRVVEWRDVALGRKTEGK